MLKVGDKVVLSAKGRKFLVDNNSPYAKALLRGEPCPITSFDGGNSWPYAVDYYQFNEDELELCQPVKCCF